MVQRRPVTSWGHTEERQSQSQTRTQALGYQLGVCSSLCLLFWKNDLILGQVRRFLLIGRRQAGGGANVSGSLALTPFMPHFWTSSEPSRLAWE